MTSISHKICYSVIAAAIVLFADAQLANAAWKEVFTDPNGNDRISAVAEFNGKLFIAASSWSGYQANIYRLDSPGCRRYTDVTPNWSPGTDGDDMELAVFNDTLYLINDSGEIYRTADGASWERMMKNFTGAYSVNVAGFAEINGMLYVLSGNGFYRTVDGVKWEKLPSLGMSGVPESIAVFDNYLYVGVGKDDSNGVEVWRSADGMAWSLDYRPDSGLGHVHALAPFNGQLYLGEYHGHGVHRTYDVLKHHLVNFRGINYVIPYYEKEWARAGDVIVRDGGDVNSLFENSGRFYLGVSRWFMYSAEPEDIYLYATEDGTNWAPVPGSQANDLGFDILSFESMADLNGRLYIGIHALPHLGGVARLYEYSPDDMSATTCTVKPLCNWNLKSNSFCHK